MLRLVSIVKSLLNIRQSQWGGWCFGVLVNYYCLPKRHIHTFPAVTSTLDYIFEHTVGQIELHDLKRLRPILALWYGGGVAGEGKTTLGHGKWQHDEGKDRKEGSWL